LDLESDHYTDEEPSKGNPEKFPSLKTALKKTELLPLAMRHP